MSASTETPVPGQIARVRQRLYLVEDTVDAKNPADSTLVRLSCVDDDAQGQQLEVLWEQEIDPEIITGEAWEEIAQRGFDEPRLFAAYLNTLRWNCVTATNPRLLQSPFRAGIRLDAYQLEPLRKALLLPRVNLFIADDVGLGKTIEAGIVLSELCTRGLVRSLLVLTPPSLVEQWQGELRRKFSLDCALYDDPAFRALGQEAWNDVERVIVSMHTAKRGKTQQTQRLEWPRFHRSQPEARRPDTPKAAAHHSSTASIKHKCPNASEAQRDKARTPYNARLHRSRHNHLISQTKIDLREPVRPHWKQRQLK